MPILTPEKPEVLVPLSAVKPDLIISSTWDYWHEGTDRTIVNTIINGPSNASTSDSVWVDWGGEAWRTSTEATFTVDSTSYNVATIRADAAQSIISNSRWESPPQRRVDALKQKREKRRISVRAASLLKSLLPAEDWMDWKRYRSIRWIGKQGIYEIGGGWVGMVYKLNHAGDPIEKLCCHPPYHYPLEDKIAAILLELMANEDGFLAKANKHSWGKHEKERVVLRRMHVKKAA